MNTVILDDINQKPKLDYAGFGLRLGAYFIDIVPIIILLNFFVYFAFGLNPINSGDRVVDLDGHLFEEATVTRVIVRYLSFFIWIIYCAIMEAGPNGGTFDKKILGLEVVDENGNRLKIGKSLTRNLTKILSYLAIALGFIWILLNKERRGWHDMFAKTYVVKNKE